jgi:hypothetical protein
VILAKNSPKEAKNRLKFKSTKEGVLVTYDIAINKREIEKITYMSFDDGLGSSL